MLPPRSERCGVRVLVVANQDDLLMVVKLALSPRGLTSRCARTVTEATTTLRTWPPDLALVDIDAQEGQFLDWLTRVDHAECRLPVIALTRRVDLDAKLVAFDRGADDILTVPFSPEELVARSLAVMRRAHREAQPRTATIRIGELEVSMLHRRARLGRRELHLTPVEQSLLYLLASNAGRLLTREEILDSLWGADFVPESNVVDRHVTKLRAKLQDDPRRPRFIVTVPGRGYRFLGAQL
ncbi:MAG TPA: response regulator transcription factor [Candidatus Dormibacteraeota bacterium]